MQLYNLLKITVFTLHGNLRSDVLSDIETALRVDSLVKCTRVTTHLKQNTWLKRRDAYSHNSVIEKQVLWTHIMCALFHNHIQWRLWNHNLSAYQHRASCEVILSIDKYLRIIKLSCLQSRCQNVAYIVEYHLSIFKPHECNKSFYREHPLHFERVIALWSMILSEMAQNSVCQK